MSTIIRRFLFITISLLAISPVLISFSSPRGGEGFEVYLDGKVIMQRFGQELNKPALLKLDNKSKTSEIKLRYYRCGATAKNKKIVLRSSANKWLKEWKLSDASDNTMTCRVADLTVNGSQLRLYFVSTDDPKGKLLTDISVTSSTVTNSRR